MLNRLYEVKVLEATTTSSPATTEDIRCLGASQVVFYAIATNATQLTSAVVQVSMDQTVWTTVNTPGNFAMGTPVGGISGVALNSGGAVLVLVPASGVPYIPWEHARLVLTPAASITGLEVVGLAM